MDEKTARPQAARCGWCRTRRVAGATVCPACGRDPSGPRPPATVATVRRAAARAHEWWPAFVAFVLSWEPEWGKVESRRRPAGRGAGRGTPRRAPARQVTVAVPAAHRRGVWGWLATALVAALPPDWRPTRAGQVATPPAGRRAAAAGRPAATDRHARPPAAVATPRNPSTAVAAATTRPSRERDPVDVVPAYARGTAAPAVPAIRSHDLMAAWRRVEQEKPARAAREGAARVTAILRADPTVDREEGTPGHAPRTRGLITPAAREDLERRMAERRRAAAVAPAEVDRQQVVRRANVERA